MAYTSLEKLFYADASNRRFARHKEAASKRLNDESTFRTGVMLEHGELFCAVPRELSVAAERVLRKERRVSALWRGLPRVALGKLIRSLVLDEVVFSNEIESVHSTRQQIEAALEAARPSDADLAGASGRPHQPFAEFAELYLGLSANPKLPETLEDIRAAYDAVTDGAIDPSDLIRGSMFRRGPVLIENERGKIIHQGVAPGQIGETLSRMLALAHSDDIPELYASLLCHFIFEYTHPFYDGNGRTGRYLLALQLSRPLSEATVLSLSRAIAENKSAYYKAFDTVERPLNCAEGTLFVLTMLDLISEAQDNLIADLGNKTELLDTLAKHVGALGPSYTERERSLLFFMGQMHLFEAFANTRADEAADYLGVTSPTARKAFDALLARGVIAKVKARPAIYRLTPQGTELLGIAAAR